MKLIFKPQLPAALTYLGVLFSLIGCLFVINQQVAPAIVCLLMAVTCDFFDGQFAKSFKHRSKAEQQFGIEIDSLADAINFAVLPVLILCQITAEPLMYFAAILLAFCGITRLAVFNITTSKTDNSYYHGLPIPFSALLCTLIYLLGKITTVKTIAPILTMLCAFAFVSDIGFKKPKTIPAYLFWLGIILLTIIGVFYASL